MKRILAALGILLLAACSSVCKCPQMCGCDCPAHDKPNAVSPEKTP